MLSSIFITLVVLTAFGSALRSSPRGDIIAERPYNNQHSDATGARDGKLSAEY